MFPDFMENEAEERVNIKLDVMYKTLDRTDENYQGLFRKAETRYIDRRGMGIEIKEKVEAGDILINEMFFEEEFRLLKTCCEVKNCSMKKNGLYDAKIEFIIIKENDKAFWEEFLFKKMEMLI